MLSAELSQAGLPQEQLQQFLPCARQDPPSLQENPLKRGPATLCSQEGVGRVTCSRDITQQGMRAPTAVPTTLLVSQDSKCAAKPISLAQFCFYVFTEGLPTPAHPWQKIPEHFSGFYFVFPLQKFTFLMLVLNTWSTTNIPPVGVITSLHFCRGNQGN